MIKFYFKFITDFRCLQNTIGKINTTEARFILNNMDSAIHKLSWILDVIDG